MLVNFYKFFQIENPIIYAYNWYIFNMCIITYKLYIIPKNYFKSAYISRTKSRTI